MDILTTGQTKTSAERLKVISEFIKNIQRDYRDKVNQHGLKYGNLLDFLNTKAKEGGLGPDQTNQVTETEYRDALRVLEEDNVISMFGHSRAPTIRFV